MEGLAVRGELSPSSGLMCEIVNCLHLPEKVREFQKPLTVATMSVDFNNKFAYISDCRSIDHIVDLCGSLLARVALS